MTRVKNLDCQVSSLNDDNGKPRQFADYWPPSAISRGDATAGARLWTIGDQLLLPVWKDPATNPSGSGEWNRTEAVWTPPVMPEGYTKAVRYSPSPVQPHVQGQRPRCQTSLTRVQLPDPDAILADPSLGIPPDPPFTSIGERLYAQPITGYVNTDRSFVDYFCLPPDFDHLAPNFIRATTILSAWHGSAGGDISTPPVQFNLRRTPNDDGPIHMTLTVAAGRSWPVAYGLPPWPYDSFVANPKAPGGLSYTEVRREFYITDPDGPGITREDWHKYAVRMFHHYTVGVGITEVWFDGVKMVGAGGRNVEVPDVKVKRGAGDPGPVDLGDYSGIPNIFLDDAGPQTQRLAVYYYAPNQGYNAKTADIYHWQVWNNAVWHTGMGVFTDVAEVSPALPARVFAPRPVETFSIFGEPSFEVLRGGPIEEDVSVLPDAVGERPRFLDGTDLHPFTTVFEQE